MAGGVVLVNKQLAAWITTGWWSCVLKKLAFRLLSRECHHQLQTLLSPMKNVGGRAEPNAPVGADWEADFQGSQRSQVRSGWRIN